MARWIAAVTLLLVAAIGAYFYYLYPPSQYKRMVEHRLDAFSRVIATGNAGQIDDELQDFLTDDAAIHLNVSLYSPIPGEAGHGLLDEDFTKPSFKAFIDGLLASLQSYGFAADIMHFDLAPDHQSAQVTFTSTEAADGMSNYGGTAMHVRFSVDTKCEATFIFTNKVTHMQTAHCTSLLHSLPKEGEESKLRNNPEGLQQFLQR